MYYSQCPKSEHPCVRTSSVRILVIRAWALSFGTKLLRTDKSVWNPNRLFRFQTQIYKFTNLHICVWNSNILFRLSYMCSDFRHFCLFEVIWYRTEGDCLKSKHVRISDVYCIQWTSEIRTCSDFRHLAILPFESLFGSKSVWNPNRIVRISDVFSYTEIRTISCSNVQISASIL